jgi:hypothetical protein
MTSVTQPTIKAKPRAFYAHLDDQAGLLTKVNGTLFFMVPETGDITEIEAEHTPFLTVLGQVDVAMAQWMEDMVAGGYAAKACNREMGVN